MEQTECSEMLAYTIQAPGNYPEESIQHVPVSLFLMYSEFQVACIFRLCHMEIENKKMMWSVLCIFDTVRIMSVNWVDYSSS